MQRIGAADWDFGLEMGANVVKRQIGHHTVNLLFKLHQCGSIGDSKVVFLKFPPFVRSGSILFGTSTDEREGVLLLLTADWLHTRQVVAMT